MRSRAILIPPPEWNETSLLCHPHPYHPMRPNETPDVLKLHHRTLHPTRRDPKRREQERETVAKSGQPLLLPVRIS